MILHGGPDDPLGDSGGDLTSTRAWPRLGSDRSQQSFVKTSICMSSCASLAFFVNAPEY